MHREQIFCLACAGLFAIGSMISSGETGFLGDGFKIARTGYGELDREYELLVEGLSDTPEKLVVKVGARQYTEEEARAVFSEILEEIPLLICGENQSLTKVEGDLKLIKSIPEKGIKLSWYPEDAELISYDGEVRNERLEKERSTFLKLVLTDGKTSTAYDLPVTVVPPSYDEREKLLSDFGEMLSLEDERQITGEELTLPEEFEGRKLKYRREPDLTPAVIFSLGIVAAVSLAFKEKTEESARLKRREAELLMDYSELVSKLMVFLGAGFGIRGAWEKIVEGYERSGSKGALSEEMKISLGELRRGVPEGKVYTDFGRRCRLRPYIKLCSILEQNRKNGGRNIRFLLGTEMSEAFLERKNIAKRLGEEAGTKLLVPLFIMLMIVMVIVILPAMLALN